MSNQIFGKDFFAPANHETVKFTIAAIRDIESHLGTDHDFDIPLLKQLLGCHQRQGHAPWMVSAEYRAYAVLGKTI